LNDAPAQQPEQRTQARNTLPPSTPTGGRTQDKTMLMRRSTRRRLLRWPVMHVDAPLNSGVPSQAWVLMALAVWLLATLGWRPLMLPDEGRYAEVAREMLLGDAAVPQLLGLPYFHKPPLMYWLDMAAMQVLGVNAFAARIAPALGAWLMGAALYVHMRHRVGVLATTPFFFIGAQYANHDMLVAGLITVAVVLAQQAVHAQQHPAWRWVVAAWCAMALAVLAKGLIGVVLPALIVGPWLLVHRRWRDLLRLLHPLAIIAFALIAVPWFVAMQHRYPGFVDYFFLEQHVRRFAQTGFNNQQPFWFFVPVMLLLTLPWSLWLLDLARRLRAARTPMPMPSPSPSPVSASASAPTQWLLWQLWWVAAVLGFFSVPSSKLVGYALPALAPFAALLGVAVCRGQAWRWLLPIAAIACLACVFALAWAAPHSHRDVGQALAARWQAGDRVVLVEGAFFDVPFYAALSQPPVVLSDWDDPHIPHHDDWRKELHDAARFGSTGQAQHLWPLARAAELLCTERTVWFVAAKDWRVPPELGVLVRVHEGRHAALLQTTGAPPVCR
jgi:4-amino-4-deoxy-L-arabinose transferase-like glycosyltransferase